MEQDGSVGNFLTEQEADGGDSFGRQNFVGQMSASAGMPVPAFVPAVLLFLASSAFVYAQTLFTEPCSSALHMCARDAILSPCVVIR